jgi:hypothetical protein
MGVRLGVRSRRVFSADQGPHMGDWRHEGGFIGGEGDMARHIYSVSQDTVGGLCSFLGLCPLVGSIIGMWGSLRGFVMSSEFGYPFGIYSFLVFPKAGCPTEHALKSSLNAHSQPTDLATSIPYRIVSATSPALFLLSSPRAVLHAPLKRDVLLLFHLFVFMFRQAERLAPLCGSRVTGGLPDGLSGAGRGEGLVGAVTAKAEGAWHGGR